MIKQGAKSRCGYRVIGKNTSDWQLNMWYFPTLETANHFAKQLATDTEQEVTVTKYIGTWRRASLPLDFIQSED